MGFLNQYIDMPLQKFRRPVVVQIAVKKVYSYNAKCQRPDVYHS